MNIKCRRINQSHLAIVRRPVDGHSSGPNAIARHLKDIIIHSVFDPPHFDMDGFYVYKFDLILQGI